MSEAEYLALFKLYHEDVESLLELTFPQGPVRERHVRQASVIVRRWLCDNELKLITDQVCVPVTFPILDDVHLFEAVERDPHVDYYLSAGVRFDGRPVWALYHSNAGEPAPWVAELQRIKTIEVKLGKAIKRPALYFDGTIFSMMEVLRFACNKLGGAHLDLSRDERQTKLDVALRYITFGPPEDGLEPGRTGTIHLELERDGSEVLSGISVIVIVAATMMVNILFDGDRLIELNVRKSIPKRGPSEP